jgi:hypothetical protein
VIENGVARDHALGVQVFRRHPQSDPATGDGGRAGATIGLDNVDPE